MHVFKFCLFVLPKKIKKLKDEFAELLSFYFENFLILELPEQSTDFGHLTDL